jgi:thiol-disulfide isomerase/thioredoxin
MLFRSGVSPIRLILRPPCAALLAVALLAGGCDRQKAQPEQAPLPQTKVAPGKAAALAVDRTRAGQAASTASFIAPDDARVTLAAFRGKPLLLNLWATWCAPCIKEMPSLDRLASQRAGQLTVLTVAQDIQGAGVVDPWFQQARLRSLQPYLDPDNNLLAAYNSPLPVTILFDAQGRELWRVTGALDWQGAEARQLLAEVG